MKRFIAFLTCITCILSLFCFTVSAEETTAEGLIKNELSMLQTTYAGIVNEEYMIARTMEHFRHGDGDVLPWEKTLPADEFEAVLSKYFAYDEAMLADIRAFSFYEGSACAFAYNEAEDVYSCQIEALPVGGFTFYEFTALEQSGNAYKAYYCELEYESLQSALPDGVDEFDYAMELDFPEYIEYGGKTYYQSEYGLEYNIKTSLDRGLVYTVEINDGTVRVLSYTDYVASDLPGYEANLPAMFVEQLEFLDGYYSHNLADYAEYKMTRLLVDKEWDDFSDTLIPADLFEETLDKYFVLDDETFAELREITDYDPVGRTYTLVNIGGFGGGVSARQYTAYKEDNGVYEVFYNTVLREYMSDEFDDYGEYYAYIEAAGYPETITYEGKTYTQGDYGEYEIIHGLADTGNKYTVDVKNGIVRVYSISSFEKEEHPDYKPELDEVFDNGLWLLNGYYEYGYAYMLKIMQDELFTSTDYSVPTVVTEELYEDTLNKFFVADEDTIEELRVYDTDYLKYDADEGTYSIYYAGGLGGFLLPREYMGYKDNKDDTYDVFYQHITYEFLSEVLPEGTNENEYAEELDWPSIIVYGGDEYQNGPDGYYRIKSYDDYGMKYTVSINDDWTVRLLAVSEFDESDLPGRETGDVDGDFEISANDAIYLLYNVFFGEESYPVYQSCDFDGDGDVTANDAIYLLYHVFFGKESYPITPSVPDNDWTGNY